jgi:hypothetical protein
MVVQPLYQVAWPQGGEVLEQDSPGPWTQSRGRLSPYLPPVITTTPIILATDNTEEVRDVVQHRLSAARQFLLQCM